eukprot:TRINITY_DN489_c0_g1_i2.p1 TRINITY_DN489_c0_g1~~TRINITY_DN489_c0_g1_i2.p1  ORF type:complete len:3581 (+),score=247.31 TRINITY_DN489_c0_g1_i2:188-10930(+)
MRKQDIVLYGQLNILLWYITLPQIHKTYNSKKKMKFSNQFNAFLLFLAWFCGESLVRAIASFQYFHTSSGDQVGGYIVPSMDGQYFVAGSIDDSSTGGYDTLLLKVNKAGGLTWSQKSGCSVDEMVQDVTTDTYGNCLVLGYRRKNCVSTNPTVPYVAKFGGTYGNLIWAREAQVDNFIPRGILFRSGGRGIVLVGYGSGSYPKGTLVYMDSEMTTVEQAPEVYAGACTTTYFEKAVEDSMGKVIVTGYCEKNAYPYDYDCIFAVHNGASYTTVAYRGENYDNEKCYSIAKLDTGNYAIGGESGSGSYTSYYFSVMTASGYYVADDKEGSYVRDVGKTVWQLPGTSIAIAGKSRVDSSNYEPRVYLYDTSGNYLTSVFESFSYDDNVESMSRGSAGELVLAGRKYNLGYYGLFVVSFGCSPGWYNDTSNVCQKCYPGYYQLSNAQTYCEPCSAGTYSTEYGTVLCKDCPIGTYQSMGGATGCIGCPIGTYQAYKGSIGCSTCPTGTYQDQTGQGECTSCNPGTYNDLEGQSSPTSCKSCVAGTYQPDERMSYCIDCPTGTYQPLSGMADCELCSSGTYSPLTRQTSSTTCIPCSVGNYQPSSGMAYCAACSPGYYQTEEGASSCIACNAGTYNPLTGSYDPNDCLPCPLGKYQSNVGSESCTRCSPGYYQDQEQQTNCKPCDSGKYNPLYEQTSISACLDCSVGTFQQYTGQSSCDSCNYGSYQDQVGQTSCIPCSVGTYQDALGTTSCKECVPGTYQDQTGQSYCHNCPVGQYQDLTGKTSCIDCPIGTFQSQSGSTGCTDCPEGKYQDTVGSGYCSSCPPGTYNPLTKRTSLSDCISCELGKYQPSSDSTSCIECPAGQYQDQTGETSCKYCPAGTYNDATGQTSLANCIECSAGTYQPLDGQTSCISCEVGTYQDLPGQTSCNLCGAGFYNDQTGQTGVTSCLECPAGKYQPSEGQSSCIECPAGKYQDSTAQISCINCGVGTYNELTGQDSAASCLQCPLGKYQPSEGQTSCYDCPIGEYQDTQGQDACKKCGEGTYNALTAQTSIASCLPCDMGTYQPSVGMSSCLDCPTGTYQDSTGSISCTECDAGTFNPDTKQTDVSSCQPCPAGQHQPSTGQTSCIECSAGEFQSNTGQISCNPCPTGTSQSLTGQSICDPCSKGYYQDATGSISCKACEVGKYQDQTEQTSCKDCAAGTFQDLTGMDSCKPCPAGYYQDQLGQGSCAPCPVGQHQPDQGQTGCIVCGPGTYQDLTGQASCKSCDPGYYQTQSEQTECIACSAGTYQNLPGQTGCIDCEVGKYQSLTGKASCDLCSPGTYQASTGKTSCDSCVAGTHQSLEGQTGCEDCAVGMFSSQAGAADCTQCSPGQYQDLVGQTSCNPCAIGKHQSFSGQTECVDCEAGTFTNVISTADCTPCPPGQYQDLTGQTSCTPCDIGKHQSYSGQTSCVDCEAGTFTNKISTADCTPCSPGQYQPLTGKTSCDPCDVGKHQSLSGQISCEDCEAGTFTNKLSTADCTPCPAGQYQPLTGQTTCNPCDIGTSQPNLGMTSCVDCSAGHYQPLTGKALCDPCPPGKYQDQTKQIECKSCLPSTYQDQSGQDKCITCPEGTYSSISAAPTCSVCDPKWYPAPTKDHCLYYGVFSTVDEFTANPISTSCYDANGDIIKPYSTTCRTAFRDICCQGSTMISGISCNYLLGLTDPGNTLKDNYCTACTFLDYSSCPADGLCWNDAAWTDNTVNPYSTNYTVACLEAASGYCLDKLMQDMTNKECAIIAGDCGAVLNSSAYINSWDRFRLTFSKKLQSVLPDCTSMFNEAMTPNVTNGTISCIKESDFEIDVVVSELTKPLRSFGLTNNLLKDACGMYINVESRNIELPDPPFESIRISGSTEDKCTNLTITSNIQRDYKWPIYNQFWEVKYLDTTGVNQATTDLFSKIANSNASSFTITDVDLYAFKPIRIKSWISTPYDTNVYSNTLEFTVPPTKEGKRHCGACQFDNRDKCALYNGICWVDYLDYSVTQPFYTNDCLKVMASVCYEIWKAKGASDPQCNDFSDHFNYTEMEVKPTIIAARYSSTGKSISIFFDRRMNQEVVTSCNDIFTQETLNWLPEACTIYWYNSTCLQFDYDPQVGIMGSLQIKENTLFYNYKYPQTALDAVTVEVELPKFEPVIRITGVTTVSQCDSAEFFAVVVTPSLYPIMFKWKVAFTSTLSDTLASEAEEYFGKFAEFSTKTAITIPNKFLVQGGKVNITLEAKASKFESEHILAKTVVNILAEVPKVKFAAKSQNVLELDGSKSNYISLQVSSRKCGDAAELMPVQVNFQVFSGEDQSLIQAYNSEEVKLSAYLNGVYNSHKAIFVGAKQGFKYTTYYNITVRVKDKISGSLNTDNVIIFLRKPPIKCVIDSPGSLVNFMNGVVLNGRYSELPAAEDDVVAYQWKCISAKAMNVGETCACPLLVESNLRSGALIMPKEKLANMCKYVFGLTVSATSEKSKRTAYNETEFMTFSGPVTPLKGQVRKGTDNKVKDQYFTFGLGAAESAPEPDYKWTLTEIVSADPAMNTNYTEKNTFIYNFFKDELGTTIDPSIKDADNPIPANRRLLSDVQPSYLTPTDTRVLGIDRSKLLPSHKYVFGVTVYSAKAPSFLFITLNTEKQPRPRVLTITPTTGTGFTTSFVITFTLEYSADTDGAQYQIFRKNCPLSSTEPTPLTQQFSNLNTYTATLAPGLKSCNYQVEIIVRAYEYGDSTEARTSIVINEPSEPITEILKTQIANLETNADSFTMDQKITLLAEVANVEVVEPSDTAQKTAQTVFKQIDNIDAPSGILETMDDKDKPALLNTAVSTMANLVTKQQANVEPAMASSVGEKVDGYLTAVKTKEGGTYVIPSCLAALSGVAGLGTKEQSEKEFFAGMQRAMDKMTDMKLEEMLPGAPPYKLTSPSIEMVVSKNYASDYNYSKSFQTDKGSIIALPSNLTDKMTARFKNSSKGTPVIGAAMYATTYNPYNPVRNGTNISIESLNNASTQGVKPETVQKIYEDLAKGKHRDIVNVKEQNTDLLQLSFKPFEVLKDTTEVPINESVIIGTLPEGKEAVFTLPVEANMAKLLNSSIMIPVYRLPDTDTWTNENCTLDSPGITDTILNMRCKLVGREDRMADEIKGKFSATVDVVKDVFKVIRAGNYEQLTDLNALVENPTRTLAAFLSVGLILACLAIPEILLIRLDRSALYNARLETLFNQCSAKEDLLQVGALHGVFAFFSQMRKKGLDNVSKKAQRQVTPVRAETEAAKGMVKKSKKPGNGFTILTKDDKQELSDAFALYKQCKMIYDDDELQNILNPEFEKRKVLNRITQARIDDDVMKGSLTFWSLMRNEHPIFNAVAKPEITTPRSLKLIIIICALIGQLFVTGYFYDADTDESITESSEKFVGNAIIYSIAAALLMIPLKVIISVFLVGTRLTETMTREQIEASEKKVPSFQKLGFVLGFVWVSVCLYGIAMYIVTFSDTALENWMTTFFLTLFTEVVIMSQLKILVKILIGFLLMKVARSKFMLTTAGVLAGKIIGYMSKVCQRGTLLLTTLFDLLLKSLWEGLYYILSYITLI